MADNVTADPGSGGATFRTLEDASNIHWPATVVCYASTVGTPDVLVEVTPATPLPVTISGVATAANQATANTALDAIETAVEAIQAAQLADGHNVTVDNASIAVTGTFWQATQPVSGTVAVSGSVAVTDGGSSITVDDGGSTISIDDGGSAITVDGSVSVTGEVDVFPASPSSTDYLPVRLTDGTDFVSALPVTDNGGALSVDDNGGSLSIDDNAGSITVDAPVGTPVFVRLSDGSSAITVLPVSQSGTWNVGTVTAVTAISNALPAGNNNIGDVDIASALPAGTNLLGRMSASPETSTVYNGTTALTPKFAAIAASSSGNNTIVAAVTSKKIRVLAYNFIANGSVNAKFQTAAGGTDLTGLKYCVANSGICAPFNPAGWFETVAGELLNLNLSGAVAVGGELVYVEV